MHGFTSSVGWISMTIHSPLGLGSFCSVQSVQPYLAALGKLPGRRSPWTGMSHFWHNKLANSLSMNTRGQRSLICVSDYGQQVRSSGSPKSKTVYYKWKNVGHPEFWNKENELACRTTPVKTVNSIV